MNVVDLPGVDQDVQIEGTDIVPTQNRVALFAAVGVAMTLSGKTPASGRTHRDPHGVVIMAAREATVVQDKRHILRLLSLVLEIIPHPLFFRRAGIEHYAFDGIVIENVLMVGPAPDIILRPEVINRHDADPVNGIFF